jgi:hypothetical protein
VGPGKSDVSPDAVRCITRPPTTDPTLQKPMTDNSQSRAYRKLHPAALEPGEALQQLYSYTESTGPSVGGVIRDLQDSATDTSTLVDQITANSDAFTAPKDGSDRHFTDLVGDAREAVESGDPENALELLDKVIIPLLDDTVSVFEDVEATVEEMNGVPEDTVDEVIYVRVSYSHMHELATESQSKLVDDVATE